MIEALYKSKYRVTILGFVGSNKEMGRPQVIFVYDAHKTKILQYDDIDNFSLLEGL
mgnify:CR=1 FL=1